MTYEEALRFTNAKGKVTLQWLLKGGSGESLRGKTKEELRLKRIELVKAAGIGV